MRRMIAWLLPPMLLSLGCSYYSKDFEMGRVVSTDDYQIVRSVTVSKTGFRFLYIPISIPSVRDVVAEQVALAGGHDAINVEVTFSEFGTLLPFSFPVLQVSMDVIRYGEGSADQRMTPMPVQPKEKKEKRGLFD